MPLGLSPPTRGSQMGRERLEGDLRFIPAHAGEPCSVRWRSIPSRVYPRPRGGARDFHFSPLFFRGLSPPTRGARSYKSHASPSRGLSPPTRGSHVAEDEPGSHAGSIPAHAGEPAHRCLARRPAMVYPRPRGGACSPLPGSPPGYGLSPPTRGSQAALVLLIHARGSIPAHAGEPRRERGCAVVAPVYPRPRGGALFPHSLSFLLDGLSPPTRGSRGGDGLPRHPLGSIPAHAGEPASLTSAVNQRKVYPRPRGGASLMEPGLKSFTGLSPPTRGSRPRRSE